MTDKEKIKAELKRRIKNYEKLGLEIEQHFAIECEDLISFIDSMQKEPKKCMFTKDNFTEEDRKVLCEDCEEECEYAKKKESVSEDLEEACEQLAENARKHKAETSSPFFNQTDYKQGVIDGAQWQKQQMMKDIIKAEVRSKPNDYGEYMPEVIVPVSHSYRVGDKVKLIIIKEG